VNRAGALLFFVNLYYQMIQQILAVDAVTGDLVDRRRIGKSRSRSRGQECRQYLGLTQSALSQRILGLEDELETALFIRDGRSVKLTEAGERLLSFCHAGKSLEDEFLDSIKGNGLALAGPIRIAGY